MKNAIVVKTENDQVIHRFCSAEDAKILIDEAHAARQSAVTFTIDRGFEAALLYDTSPDLRSRVEEAKTKLRRDMHIQATLDKYGVPDDYEVRIAVGKAVLELLGDIGLRH